MMKFVVLICLVAAASAGFIAPIPYSSPFGYAAPVLTPYNYRGPLSLGPTQPANILGTDGRPLDTLEVNLNRAAHFNAKALDSGIHLLKKRAIFTPIIGASINRADSPLIAPSTPFALRYAAARFSPITYSPAVYTHFF